MPCPPGDASESPDPGKSMKWKVKAQQNRASAMNGMERSKMRRRPRRSMKRRETMVKRKFVVATESEVSVGVAKPRREKRVAEKYMREFWAGVRREHGYTIDADR